MPLPKGYALDTQDTTATLPPGYSLDQHVGGASGSWDAAPPSIPQRILSSAEELGGGDTNPQNPAFVHSVASVTNKVVPKIINPIGQSLGVAKGLASTGFNIYKLVGDMVGDPVSPSTQRAAEDTLSPKSPAESINKMGEQAGEFMLGEGALTKAATKIPAVAKAAAAAPRIARAATAALSGAAVAKAQGASNESAAYVGATGAALPALIEGTAAGLKWLGTRTMAAGVGISGKHAAAGANVETLTKFGVARATLGRTLDAVHSKIVGLATDLRNLVQGANAGTVDQGAAQGLAAAPFDSTPTTAMKDTLPGAGIGGGTAVGETAAQRAAAATAHRQAVIDAIKAGRQIPDEVAVQYPELKNSIALSKIPGPKVDLMSAVDEAERVLGGQGAQLGMSPAEAQQARAALAQYRALYSGLPRGPIVPLDEAQTAKRAAGLAGAWEYGKSAADKGMERVSNLVFGNIKRAIDEGLGTQSGKLREINGQLGELMPVEQALVRRMPIEARQQPIALTDWMLIATGHPLEAGARMTMKTFPIGIGAQMIRGAQGMRTASRPLTATVQQMTAANSPRDAGDLQSVLQKNGQSNTPAGNISAQELTGTLRGSDVALRSELASAGVPQRAMYPHEQLSPDETRALHNLPQPTVKGNIDLNHRPIVENADGSISTVRSVSFGEDGKEVLIPTVSPDGRLLTNQQAIDLYRRTGQHLGKFDTADDATRYAQQLHKDQEKMYLQAGAPEASGKGLNRYRVEPGQEDGVPANPDGTPVKPPDFNALHRRIGGLMGDQFNLRPATTPERAKASVISFLGGLAEGISQSVTLPMDTLAIGLDNPTETQARIAQHAANVKADQVIAESPKLPLPKTGSEPPGPRGMKLPTSELVHEATHELVATAIGNMLGDLLPSSTAISLMTDEAIKQAKKWTNTPKEAIVDTEEHAARLAGNFAGFIGGMLKAGATGAKGAARGMLDSVSNMVEK